MTTRRALLAMLGVVLSSSLTSALQEARSPREERDLTAAEREEVEQLRAGMNAHIASGRFEAVVKVAKQVADYRAERQGDRHWETVEARLRMERWQQLTLVPVKDRGEVVRGLRLG